MDAFYVRSNISPKDDMAHDADYIIDNFTNWQCIIVYKNVNIT